MKLDVRTAQPYSVFIENGVLDRVGEIARMLGYTSIHYFSRHFKKVTKMTPSEYATSVKMLSRRGRGENV